jgi:hypothetical protein
MTVCFGGETGPGFGVDRNFLSDARSIPHDVSSVQLVRAKTDARILLESERCRFEELRKHVRCGDKSRVRLLTRQLVTPGG